MAEILAPCGGKESFFSAINNYADAVYLGLDDFSARKNAENFTRENISYYIAYAHTFNVKVYVCINTIVKNSELDLLFETVKTAYLAQADAFIVQDIFLGKKLKELFPNIVLHLSTQAGVCNVLGAELAKDYGFSRVILARETEITEIKAISAIIETEIFVHGALCTCLSGHCYLSSVIGGNSGNRGLCRQPCRQKYKYSFNNKECYALSLADLCLSDKLDELISAGVSSFKIEGRMRSPEYVGACVRLYKNALNHKSTSLDLSLAKRTFNRGNWTKGYVFGEDKNLLSSAVQGHMGEFVEKVEAVSGDKIFLKKSYLSGSGFKIFRNGLEVGNGIIKTDGKELLFSGNVKKGDLIYITKDSSLSKITEVKRLKEIDVKAEFLPSKRAMLSACGQVVYSQNILEESRSAPITKASVLENLSRVDVYPFAIKSLDYNGGNAFLPKSELNRLRKNLFEKIFYGNNIEKPINGDGFKASCERLNKNEKSLAVISSRWLGDHGGDITHFIFAPTEYKIETVSEFLIQSQNSRAKKYLYIPAFLTNLEIENIQELVVGFDGLYVESPFGLKLCEKLHKKAFGGIELNIFNKIDRQEISQICDDYCSSKELSIKELNNFDGFVFALGSIKVMSLIYCPNKRDCANCNVGDLETLKDYGNRVFAVRRYKTSKCRFEIFNESLLCSKVNFNKMIFDLSGLEENKAQELLKDYFEIGFSGIAKKYKVTNFSLNSGIK